jgi:hypothetical protein
MLQEDWTVILWPLNRRRSRLRQTLVHAVGSVWSYRVVASILSVGLPCMIYAMATLALALKCQQLPT